MLYSEKLKAFAAAHPCEHITVDGVQYRHLLRGKESARTLVFLNGGMNTLEMWMDYVDGLSGDCRVLLFDYPQALRTNQELVAGMCHIRDESAEEIACVSGGHLSTVLKADAYIQTIRSFLHAKGTAL